MKYKQIYAALHKQYNPDCSCCREIDKLEGEVATMEFELHDFLINMTAATKHEMTQLQYDLWIEYYGSAE